MRTRSLAFAVSLWMILHMVVPGDSIGSTKDFLSSWDPKASFDGRVAGIIVKNTSPNDIVVRLWHPDSREPFKAYTMKGLTESTLEYEGSAISVGSDWGVQIGGTRSPVWTLSEVSEWKKVGGQFYWYLVLPIANTARSPKDFLSYWEPKTSFDGRVAGIIVSNTSRHDVVVRLWHPDSKQPFESYTIGGLAESVPKYEGSAISVGSDWGIQIGGTRSPVWTLSEVSEWKKVGGQFYWYLVLPLAR